jgi:hypothetical protein
MILRLPVTAHSHLQTTREVIDVLRYNLITVFGEFGFVSCVCGLACSQNTEFTKIGSICVLLALFILFYFIFIFFNFIFFNFIYLFIFALISFKCFFF